MDRHMADPSIFDSIRIPTETLIALDWRPYHFAMQPYHYLLRTAHILSMALFFGGIGLLDLQLMGWLRAVPLKPFAEFVLPCLYLTFAVTAVTGVALFLYDPLFAGSRAYWIAAPAPDGQMPRSARLAGALSLIFWSAALVFACLNTEAMPKVLLR
jgi:hypothetical protein